MHTRRQFHLRFTSPVINDTCTTIMGITTLELSSYESEIPNDAYTTLKL